MTPWTAACQASLSFTVSWSLLKLMSIELVMLSNHLIHLIPFSSCLQSFPVSGYFPMNWLFVSGGQSIWTDNNSFIYIQNCYIKNKCHEAAPDASSSRPLCHCSLLAWLHLQRQDAPTRWPYLQILSIYYMPVTVLGLRDTVMNKTGK